LFASNLRGARALNQRLALLSIARSVESDLPDSSKILPGRLSGEMDGRTWSVDIRPFIDSGLPLRSSSSLTPEHVAITVTDANGDRFSLDTVRLQRGRGK
jgi:hypothetical protein